MDTFLIIIIIIIILKSPYFLPFKLQIDDCMISSLLDLTNNCPNLFTLFIKVSFLKTCHLLSQKFFDIFSLKVVLKSFYRHPSFLHPSEIVCFLTIFGMCEKKKSSFWFYIVKSMFKIIKIV